MKPPEFIEGVDEAGSRVLSLAKKLVTDPLPAQLKELNMVFVIKFGPLIIGRPLVPLTAILWLKIGKKVDNIGD